MRKWKKRQIVYKRKIIIWKNNLKPFQEIYFQKNQQMNYKNEEKLLKEFPITIKSEELTNPKMVYLKSLQKQKRAKNHQFSKFLLLLSS